MVNECSETWELIEALSLLFGIEYRGVKQLSFIGIDQVDPGKAVFIYN